jgi:hypothetical protein
VRNECRNHFSIYIYNQRKVAHFVCYTRDGEMIDMGHLTVLCPVFNIKKIFLKRKK